MKYNIYCLVTKGDHHLILILTSNWLHSVHKNFLLHNKEYDTIITKKVNLSNSYKLKIS